jgi:hypothetical protein
MRTRRVTVSAGKPGEENADGVGFAASGASQYSRRVSHYASPDDLKTHVDSRPRLVGMIAKHERELGKYQGKLKFARDPKERERLLRHIGIKQEFLERLRGDRRSELAGTS